MAVSHLETDLNTPSERTVAILAGLFRMEPHDLVEATSYPLAKSDRLPLVVNRWTEVEHQLALLERDLWWLDAAAAGSPASEMAERVLVEWEVALSKLASRTVDRPGTDALSAALRLVADRRQVGP